MPATNSSSAATPAAGRTLRLRRPFGRTLLWTAVMLVLGVAAAEGIARLPWVRAHFPFTSTNNPNTQFDRLLSALDQRAARDGGVECIILGSSLVRAGFSAAHFTASYTAAGGASPPLRCVPFGMPAMVAEQAGVVARLLAQLYHPRLLIFGTSARDFNDKITDHDFNADNDFAQAAWVRYRLGEEASLEGWLVEHSYAYRYSLNLRQWLHYRYYTDNPPRGPAPNLDQAPDPVDEDTVFAAMASYVISARGLAGLDSLLALRGAETNVVIVEMPVHPTYVDFFEDGAEGLARWRQAVLTATEASGATFISAHLELTIPSDGWYDRLHLDNDGQVVFSNWLGREAAMGNWRASPDD
jgi:hypothetical protein